MRGKDRYRKVRRARRRVEAMLTSLPNRRAKREFMHTMGEQIIKEAKRGVSS